MIFNSYDFILSESTKEETINAARSMVWDEIELSQCEIGYHQYIDTIDGVEIYYDYGADYYFFCPANEEIEK